MKKVMLLASAMLLAGSAMAQTALVKDALKAIKPSSKSVELKAVLQSLQPAFTDEASKDDPATWYAAGKAAYGLFDALEVDKTLKKEAVDEKEMNKALVDGYNYCQKALSIESVIDRDKNGQPKVDKKTGEPKRIENKYVKDVNALLDAHVSSYGNAGNSALSAQDWESVETFFGLFGDNVKKMNPAYPDSALAEIRFFEGYGAYQQKSYEHAYEAFTKAIKLGYKANSVEEFQYACLGTVVQADMDANKMDAAEKRVQAAIDAEPTNAKYQNLMGILVERKTGGLEAALPFFTKAIECDPTNSDAQFNVGRYYYNQAAEIIKANPDLMGDKLLEKTKPIYEKALPYLEKAYQLNNDNKDAKNALRMIFYQLGDEANYNKYSE